MSNTPETAENNYTRVLAGLNIDYTAVFSLDLDTDLFDIFVNQQTNHAQNIQKPSSFRDYVDDYAEKYVIPEYQEAMRRELNSTTIRSHFETANDYYFSFETTPNQIGQRCFQAHIVKQYQDSAHFAVLGFRCVDAAVENERRYQASLAKANRALQHQLDMITAAIPGGIKISNDDPTYSFRYVSEQFAAMLGYDSPDELMQASGGSIVGLAHPDDLETGIASALDQYTRSDHYATTYRMRCKDGSWKYIEDRGHKVVDANGVVSHWNLILDKNELVEKTIALESEKRANKAKTDFLSRMSHDMRTPLNGVIGLLDICAKHPENRALVDSSREKARVAANHLLSLVNDTLELNKLGDTQVPLHEETFDAGALFEEIKTIASMYADSAGVALRMEGTGPKLQYPWLVGCPLQIKRIWLNLITNAIKYNKEGGSVCCTLQEIPQDAETIRHQLVVQDTGIGMSEEFLKEIYEPFAQADHGARSTYMGTGLGMAIVKNLLDRMGGTIQVDSKLGVGTTITVTLPLKIARKAPDAPLKNQPKTQTKRKNIHVLLAEDNELNRGIAEFMLRDEGIHVTTVEDGRQAVEAFTGAPAHTFDVILMDIMMPVMNGIEATKTIRASGRQDAQTIPILAMTANAFDEDRQKTREAGMNEHLTKPLRAEELVATIRKYCGDQN